MLEEQSRDKLVAELSELKRKCSEGQEKERTSHSQHNLHNKQESDQSSGAHKRTFPSVGKHDSPKRGAGSDASTGAKSIQDAADGDGGLVSFSSCK